VQESVTDACGPRRASTVERVDVSIEELDG
jgi:hypothetical protein